MDEVEKYQQEFFDESFKYIKKLNNSLLVIEKESDNKKSLNKAFRSVHSLKGMAAMMGYEKLAELTHKMESLLYDIRQGKLPLHKPVLDCLFTGLEYIEQLVFDIRTENNEKQNIKKYMHYVQQIIQGDFSVSFPDKDLEPAKKEAPLRKTENINSSGLQVTKDKLDKLMNKVQEQFLYQAYLQVVGTGHDIYQDLIQNLSEATDQLYEQLLQVRTLSAQELYSRLLPLVRSLSRKKNKKIKFRFEGANIRVDREITGELTTILIHLIRNAVAHGIEKPEIRKQRGKDSEGEISVQAAQDGDKINFRVQDDGSGLRIEEIARQAAQRGLVEPEKIKELTEQQKLDLIFEPGLSTASEVTEISGRGVGLDVVKNTVDKLQGEINLTTRVGAGTTFSVLLPCSRSYIRAYLFELNNRVFALPETEVRETIKAGPEDLEEICGRQVIVHQNTAVPLVVPGVCQDEKKFLDKFNDGSRFSLLIISRDSSLWAAAAEKILAQKNIIKISSGKQNIKLPELPIEYIGGVGLTADGETVLLYTGQQD